MPLQLFRKYKMKPIFQKLSVYFLSFNPQCFGVSVNLMTRDELNTAALPLSAGAGYHFSAQKQEHPCYVPKNRCQSTLHCSSKSNYALQSKVGVFSRILRGACRHLHTSKIYRPITSSWLTGLRLQHRRSDLSQKVVFKREKKLRTSPTKLLLL